MTAAWSSMIAAVILAGGRGSRMGGERPKPLVALGGRPLLAWVLSALPGDIAPVAINADPPDDYAIFGLPVIADRRPGHAGPLAGLEAASHWVAREARGATHVLALPADTPFLTPEILQRLCTMPAAKARVARHAGRLHPTVTLWPLPALAGLGQEFDPGSKRSILGFLERIGFEAVDVEGTDPFFNVNTPADLAAAEKRIRDR